MNRVGNSSGNRSQAGMASILITMVTMIVITLIVLGFASVARREQGQTLDRQLSTQAFYAAESGIEDARVVIEKAVAAKQAVPGKTDCTRNDPQMGGYAFRYPIGAGTQVGGDPNVSYSCLTVDPNPTSLQYRGVNADSIVVPVNTANPAAVIDHVEVTWSPSKVPDGCARTDGGSCAVSTRCLDASTNVTNGRFFSPGTGWTCLYGLMRMDMVATAQLVNIGGQARVLNRDRLLNSQVGAFFVPTQDTGTSGEMDFGLLAGTNMATRNPQATIIEAKCEGQGYGVCRATITNTTASNQYKLRLSSLYQQSDVTVIAYDNADRPLPLTGAQAVVDATGKAQDVLRRIVVRVPVTASRSTVAGSAITTNGAVCKRFRSTADFYQVDNNYPTGQHDSTNDMCKADRDGSPRPD